MNKGLKVSVVVCWPSKPSEIARLNRLTEVTAQFTPTVDHQLSVCDSCERSIWISGQQLQMTRSPLFRNNKLCMFCVNEIRRQLNIALTQVDVAPQLARSRKRRV